MPCPGCVEALDGKREEVVEEVEAVEFLGLANAELFAQDSRRTRHRACDHVKITEYLKFYLLSKVIYCTVKNLRAGSFLVGKVVLRCEE